MARIRVWRITHERYADSAFDGTGAETYGGRFNNVGTRVVYTAESLSLALLELLVRVNRRERLAGYVSISAEIGERLVRTVRADELPEEWDAIPSPPAIRELGDSWIRSADSLVLRVPSVVVGHEWNYLINPAHTEFADVSIGGAVPIRIDRRLIR